MRLLSSLFVLALAVPALGSLCEDREYNSFEQRCAFLVRNSCQENVYEIQSVSTMGGADAQTWWCFGKCLDGSGAHHTGTELVSYCTNRNYVHKGHLICDCPRGDSPDCRDVTSMPIP